MPSPERTHVCVLGAGGLGSLVGGRLAATGVGVTLIGRPAHTEAILRDGLHIDGIRGTDHVTTHLTAVNDPAQVRGPVDNLLVTVKARDTATALEDVAALRPRAVLSLQNSITKDLRLADCFGAPAVIGAATTESATLTAPGRVRHTGTAPSRSISVSSTAGRRRGSTIWSRISPPRASPVPQQHRSVRSSGRSCCRPR